MRKVKQLEDGNILITLPMSLRCVSGRRMVITPGSLDKVAATINNERHPVLVALGRAHHWQDLIDSGKEKSAFTLAATLGLDRAYVNRTLRLTTLSPRIVRQIMHGQEPEHLSLTFLNKEALPDTWAEQEQKLIGRVLTEP